MGEVPLYPFIQSKVDGYVPQTRHFALRILGQREIFIDYLLVRVHWIIEMIVVERPCAMGV